MNLRRTHALRIALGAAVTALALAGCSSEDDSGHTSDLAAKSPKEDRSASPGAAAGTTQLPSDLKPIQTTEGDKGIVGLIYRVERVTAKAPGGIDVLKVWAGAKNTGSRGYAAVAWRDGDTPFTLAGSTVTDYQHRKRYRALLDSGGGCLCTDTGLRNDSIDPGETRPLDVEFQAPPTDVTTVTLRLGNMQPVKIPIPAPGR